MDFVIKAEIMDEQAIKRAIARICFELIEKNKGIKDLCIIGVLRRGADIAKLIEEKLFEIEGTKPNFGVVDIGRYRDDKKVVKSQGGTKIDFDINDKTVLLVDDVMYTGRTVRAAIDAIMDSGRPKNILLAALIDRGHRELPFSPDFVGKTVPTSRTEQVKVYTPKYDDDFKVVIGDLV